MPKKQPQTRYPASAIEDYYHALNQALTKWYAELGQALQGLAIFDAEESAEELEQIKAAQRRAAEEQLQLELDQARHRWEAAAALLIAGAILQAGSSVTRSAAQAATVILTAAIEQGRRAWYRTPPFGLMQDEVDRFTEANARLVRDLGDRAVENLAWLTQEIVARGGTAEELAGALERSLGVERRRALRIARHQCASLNAELSRLHAVYSGSQRYIWIHSGNPNYRPEHLRLHNTVRSWDSEPRPGVLPNCGCQAIPIYEADVGAGTGPRPDGRGPERARSVRISGPMTGSAPGMGAGGRRPPRPPRAAAAGNPPPRNPGLHPFEFELMNDPRWNTPDVSPERAYWFSDAGIPLNPEGFTGIVREINHTPEQVASMRGYRYTHSHAAGTPPSWADFVFMAYEAELLELRAVGRFQGQGYIYSIERRGDRWRRADGSPVSSDFGDLAQRIHRQQMGFLQFQADLAEIPIAEMPLQAWYDTYMQIARDIAAELDCDFLRFEVP